MGCPYKRETYCEWTGYRWGVLPGIDSPACYDDFNNCPYEGYEDRMKREAEEAAAEEAAAAYEAAHHEPTIFERIGDVIHGGIMKLLILLVIIMVVVIAIFLVKEVLIRKGVIQSKLTLELTANAQDVPFKDFELILIPRENPTADSIITGEFKKTGSVTIKVPRGTYDVYLSMAGQAQYPLSRNVYVGGESSATDTAQVDDWLMHGVLITVTDEAGALIPGDRVTIDAQNGISFGTLKLSDGRIFAVIYGQEENVEFAVSADGCAPSAVSLNLKNPALYELSVKLKAQP